MNVNTGVSCQYFKYQLMVFIIDCQFSFNLLYIMLKKPRSLHQGIACSTAFNLIGLVPRALFSLVGIFKHWFN